MALFSPSFQFRILITSRSYLIPCCFYVISEDDVDVIGLAPVVFLGKLLYGFNYMFIETKTSDFLSHRITSFGAFRDLQFLIDYIK